MASPAIGSACHQPTQAFRPTPSMSQRPRVVDGQVTVRDVLDLTLAIDHNVVDGAPAARFGAEFRALLESAAVTSPPN
jgi:pyruvate/2-oxoglutarate dehydrogenase complex dihydrolipoamide acyltransferase (E2) component